MRDRKFKRRKKRVGVKVFGTKQRPRLVVFRSNKSLSVQLVDDQAEKTLLAFSTQKLAKKESAGRTKTEMAGVLGEEVAQMAGKLKIKGVVFDRSGYKYHGRVKALADGARKGGLKF